MGSVTALLPPERQDKGHPCRPSDPCGHCDDCIDLWGDPTCGGVFIDWADFWGKERVTEDWVYPQVLARGRGHALYAKGKMGKSAFVLAMVTNIVFDPKSEDVVVYLDYEMSEDDLSERLEDEMGYGPESDTSRLYYAMLPRLEPLDTAPGAAQLMEILGKVQERHPGQHLVVVIDTTARAVHGDENSNDTVRAFYNHTGIALKRLGCTWVRIDHAGHEADRMRGASAKRDDVDVVWKLERTETGVKLRNDAKRMSWVPDVVSFERITDPVVRYVRVVETWPSGTKDLADQLDRLGVPANCGRPAARKILTAAQVRAPNATLSAALRWRRELSEDEKPVHGQLNEAPPDSRPGQVAA